MNMDQKERAKVVCPFCGYHMPIFYDRRKAVCEGLYVRCKGRNCGKVFEIVIKKDR